ncbi:hypothetical protein ACJJTC_002379, partial [Scirpophaga incertulas]
MTSEGARTDKRGIYHNVNLVVFELFRHYCNKQIAAPSTSRDHAYERTYAQVQNETHTVTVEITPDQRSTESEIQIDEREATPAGPESVVISAGDSTDSAKGYTSISVREPLSNIRAQNTKQTLQPHYATVSDDSDEMYAAIEEASVGEGSDTYAQIAPEPRRRQPD